MDTASFGHGKQFCTIDNRFSCTGLRPSTGHGFVVYSRSVSGQSKVSSSKLIHFTPSSVPDAPAPVEMLRVTKNGAVLFWDEPRFNNGSKIAQFELELKSDSGPIEFNDEFEDGVVEDRNMLKTISEPATDPSTRRILIRNASIKSKCVCDAFSPF